MIAVMQISNSKIICPLRGYKIQSFKACPFGYSEVRTYNPRGITLCIALQELQRLGYKSKGDLA